METNNNYNFSLFTPISDYSRRVRNIVISMIVMWALAVFGFQILLKAIEKPVPEKSYTQFELVWEPVKTGVATLDDKRNFAESLSHVLGKSCLKKEHREPLVTALSWSLYSGADSASRSTLLAAIAKIKESREKLAASKSEDGFSATKSELESARTTALSVINSVYGFPTGSLEAGVIAFNLNGEEAGMLNEEVIAALPPLMKTYLIHNQSILTDMKFLGFPFHYFYTGVFLLVLFVLLCLLFSMRIDRLQKKFNIVE